jgi:4-hydroxy-4-methyl-2-oxoglutarate aldolase
MFAGNVSVSHAYAHIFDFGGPVMIGGLKIQPGDLIHGDRNGVQTIPLEIAPRVPQVAIETRQCRERLIGICRSKDFSIEALRKAIREPELKS